FSSRRRHTRFSRDWSSDVCSSDLNELGLETARNVAADPGLGLRLIGFFDDRAAVRCSDPDCGLRLEGDLRDLVRLARQGKIDTVDRKSGVEGEGRGLGGGRGMRGE